MSAFHPRKSKTGNIPHHSHILHKPETIGKEFKNVSCVVVGVILYLEIQKEKLGMAESKYQRTYGACEAQSMRMVEEVCACGQQQMIGDND